MDISKFSNRYSVKRINYIDIDAVLSLCEKTYCFIAIIPLCLRKKVLWRIWKPYLPERAVLTNSILDSGVIIFSLP